MNARTLVSEHNCFVNWWKPSGDYIRDLKKTQHNARKTNASQRNAELTSRNQLCLSVKTGCFFDSLLVVTRSFHETQI